MSESERWSGPTSPPRRKRSWVTRRRTPLVMFPLLAALVVAGVAGVRLLTEDIPDPTTQGSPVTCWDRSKSPSVEQCPLPFGKAGLRWVFPSFKPKQQRCRDVTSRGEAAPTRWRCRIRVQGKPVQITYRELAAVKAGRILYDKRFGRGSRRSIPSRSKGPFRIQWKGSGKRGAELATIYRNYPYAVTISAPGVKVRDRALKSRVRFRQPERIRARRRG